MSIFKPVKLACPHCGKEMSFEACASINADRRPDLRTAILDGNMQRQACPHCANVVRLDPQLTYMDAKRGQWIAAFPAVQVDRWAELEADARQAFDKGFGPAAGPDAHEIGQSMTARVVFGWTALREKLLSADAGLDDVVVELTKLSLLRGMSDPPLAPGQLLRLVAVDIEAGTLDFITIGDDRNAADDTGSRGEQLRVPRDLYDDIVAEADDWQALRDSLSAGMFVDIQRLTRGTVD
jgi:hypothetical protein